VVALGDIDGRGAPRVPLFVPPGHFYSPIPVPAESARHLDRLEADGIPDRLPGIALDRAAMVRLWHELVPLMTDAPFPDEPSAGNRYAFVNGAYSFGDGSVLHAMIRHLRPRRIIEVGSGWSSACTVETVERYLDWRCELTFIEPHAELLHRLIGPAEERVAILPMRVQDVPSDTFSVLEPGDILFIDSTHVLRTGSDVWYELFVILPRLRPGVVVHFHDMFWPFEYPRDWTVDENRAWNEVYAVRALLTENRTWDILFFNSYFARFEPALIASTYPRFLRNTGGALWLQRRDGA
jgi:hypothetical protein